MSTPVVTTVQFTQDGKPLADVISPNVNIERPLDELPVYGTITVNGTVSDDVCLKKIELYVNGNLVKAVELKPASSSYFEAPLDTAIAPNGRRTILLKAYDSSGNSGNQSITVLVNNDVHDIGVTDIALCPEIVAEGSVSQMNVTVADHGCYREVFNLTVCVNTTIIASQLVSLTSGNCSTAIFTFNTTGFGVGNYTMYAYAEPISGENDTMDNTNARWMVVTFLADLDRSGRVNILDIFIVAQAFGSRPGDPKWNIVADLDKSGTVDILDIFKIAWDYGKTV